MADLKQRINDDTREAMRARDKERVAALRMILAAVKQKEVDSRTELDDAGVLAVLEKMARQHQDAIEQFRSAGRQDLVEKESFELEVVRAYLPQPLDEAEIGRIIDETVAETGAASVKDMGKVMAALKPRLQGRADMSAVSAKVRTRLGG